MVTSCAYIKSQKPILKPADISKPTKLFSRIHTTESDNMMLTVYQPINDTLTVSISFTTKAARPFYPSHPSPLPPDTRTIHPARAVPHRQNNIAAPHCHRMNKRLRQALDTADPTIKTSGSIPAGKFILKVR